VTTAQGPSPQTDSVEQPPPRARTIWWLISTLGVVGAGLLAFLVLSAHSAAAKKGFPFTPPIYGRYQPSFSVWGVFAIVGALVAAAAAFFLARAKRLRTATVIAIAFGVMFSFGASLAMVNGDPNEFVSPLKRTTAYFGDYQADVHLVRQLGVRRFVEDYPTILKTPRALLAAHSHTHPPGTHVLLSVLQSWFPDRLIPRALIIAFVSCLLMIPAWFIARAVAGQRAAFVAVSLLAVAPAPGVFVFLNLDALHATLLAGSAALLVWGLTKKESHWAVMLLGGSLLGFTSFFSLQVTFIAGFAVLYAFFARTPRDAIKLLIVAGIGGLLALAILRVAFGFNFLATFNAARAVAPRLKRVHAYWFFGDPGVWLVFAGLPVAALGIRELVTKRPAWLLTFFTPLLLADLTTLFLGETERVGQFATPILAAAAGAAFVRWERESGRDRPAVIAALVLVTAAQAILIEALFATVW